MMINNGLEVYGTFEGGGVRGTALVGAVKAITGRNIRFRAVAGTSAGAIVASLIAAGYSADEMLNMMLDKDFQEFKDPVSRIPVIRHFIAWQKNGLYKGDNFHRWIEEKLSVKIMGNCFQSPTFQDLPIPLTVIAADISRSKMIVFNQDKYPDMPVADAVRMSMSIPGFFCPVQFGQSLIVDGGIVSNFPVWVFEELQKIQPLPIFGLRLESENQYLRNNQGMFNLLGSLFHTFINVNTEREISKVTNLHTINLPTLGVNVTDFHLSQNRKLQLYQAGLDRTKAYLASI
ncbi:MAG TPA: patatin-like phospholipase family protein [Nostocaceae cyanobacterium]|nr:patatin-like phospholipase family protein [Nostocaceae cyanobacterium]